MREKEASVLTSSECALKIHITTLQRSENKIKTLSTLSNIASPEQENIKSVQNLEGFQFRRIVAITYTLLCMTEYVVHLLYSRFI